VDWRFWKWGKAGLKPRITSRKSLPPASKIDLSALTPPADVLLGHTAVAMMVVANEYSEVADQATSVSDADNLTRAAGSILRRYEIVRELLDDYSGDPELSMAGPLEYAREQFNRFRADLWSERVATCLVVGGFLSDFLRTLASAMPGELSARLEEVFADDTAEKLCHGVLERVIEADVEQLSRLSLWSRRVVGDTILIARAALAPDPDDAVAEERYEPLFSDILTEHTRRLDRLGLTA
jgi:hypothetical protein